MEQIVRNRRLRQLILCVLCTSFLACGAAPIHASNGSQVEGRASWYGGKFHGRKTASGERFDKDSLTAAHRTLPFGTKVKITALKSGRSVILRINDRGPFGNKGRIIDVSEAAALKLGMKDAGVISVQIKVLSTPPKTKKKSRTKRK